MTAEDYRFIIAAIVALLGVLWFRSILPLHDSAPFIRNGTFSVVAIAYFLLTLVLINQLS